MKKYLILFLVFALMCSTSLTYASTYVPANGQLGVIVGEFDNNGVAEIKGKFTTAAKDQKATFMIFAFGEEDGSHITPGSDNKSIIPFAGTAKSDVKGEFTVKVDFAGMPSGEYSAYFGPSTNGLSVARIPLYYADLTDNATALGLLWDKANANDTVENKITDIDTFLAGDDPFAGGNLNALAFRFGLYEGMDATDKSEVTRTLITYLTNVNKADYTSDKTKASGVFRTLVFMRALTEGDVADLDAYALSLPIFSAEDGLLKAWYSDADGLEKAELITRLTNLTYTTKENFEEKAIEMAILTRIHHADGDGEVKAMLTSFETYTGIATSGLKQAVYDGLERENLADYTALKTMIGELNKTPENTYSPPGGDVPSASIQGEHYTPPVVIEPVVESKGFKDVSENDWYYDAVYELYDRGIISGKSEETFAPDDSITREEIVKMLAVMENLTLTDSNAVFADVKAGDWFYPYVNAAAKCGIVNGIGEGVFGTGQNVTRQDIAVMLYNIAKAKGVTTEATEITFADADVISDYAKDAVLMLSELKVINGYEDLSFRPQNFVTRAEAAKLIREFIYINN